VIRSLGQCQVTVAGTLRGLADEAAQVQRLVEEGNPEVIVLAIGPREREETDTVLKERGEMPGAHGNRPGGKKLRHGPSGLPVATIERDFSEDETDVDDFGLFLSTSDLVFMKQLARWGEVEAPAPSYREALRLGYVRGIPVVAADFDDEGYTDVFLANVNTFSLVRQGTRLKRLAKKKFKVDSAEAFALAWDRQVTRTRGYAEVERARERKVAGGIAQEAKGRARLLAIVEFERLEGVLRAVETADAGPGAHT